MPPTEKSKHSCGHTFFPNPDLYVAVNYAPKPDCPDWVNILCEGIGERQAIQAFLSPFDAMLEAAFSTKPGKPYHVVPAFQYVPTAFIEDFGGKLALDIHLGWPACDGRVIRRRNGQPAACCVKQEMWGPPDEMYHIEFDVERQTLDAIERLHEHAGLFAFRECFARVRAWPEERRHRAIATALQKLPAAADEGAECNELALYDPEFEQWHFVPSHLLDDHDGAAE